MARLKNADTAVWQGLLSRRHLYCSGDWLWPRQDHCEAAAQKPEYLRDWAERHGSAISDAELARLLCDAVTRADAENVATLSGPFLNAPLPLISG